MVGIIFTYNCPKQKIPSCSLFVHPKLNKHCFGDGKQETMLIQNLGGQRVLWYFLLQPISIL